MGNARSHAGIVGEPGGMREVTTLKLIAIGPKHEVILRSVEVRDERGIENFEKSVSQDARETGETPIIILVKDGRVRVLDYPKEHITVGMKA